MFEGSFNLYEPFHWCRVERLLSGFLTKTEVNVWWVFCFGRFISTRKDTKMKFAAFCDGKFSSHVLHFGN